jgi:hypothetical protein
MNTPQPHKPSFALSATAIGAFSFGLTMFILSIAYAKDLVTLASVPFAIWSSLCGQPTDSPLALSVLVSMSVISFVAGGALLLVNALRARRRS